MKLEELNALFVEAAAIVLEAGSQVAGISFGDLRTPKGATQLVDRLLGRMKPGREVRAAAEKR